MKAWKIAVIAGLVGILAIGASVVFAQGEDPNPPGDETSQCGPGGPFSRDLGPFGEGCDGEGMRGELHELMFSALTEALGLSVEELEARLESEGGLMGVALAQGLSEEDARALFEEARANALNEAVEQGLIDEEQAQRMLEHKRGGHGRRGPHGERPDVDVDRAEMHALMQSALAEALGISVEELESQMEEYDGPMEVAIAQGLSEEDARALLEEAHGAAIQDALEQGLIDEEQAEHMQEHVRGGDPGGRDTGRDAPMQGDCGRRGPFGQDASN